MNRQQLEEKIDRRKLRRSFGTRKTRRNSTKLHDATPQKRNGKNRQGRPFKRETPKAKLNRKIDRLRQEMTGGP